MKKIIVLLLFLSINVFATEPKIEQKNMDNLNKSLNITILLDLSNRIDVNNKYIDVVKYGISQKDNDLEILKQILNIFKNNYESRNIKFFVNNKIKVKLLPIPEINGIFDRIKNLELDLSEFNKNKNMTKRAEDKKNANINFDFMKDLGYIYDEITKLGNYKGADIWGFFQNDISNCIINDGNYRNIIVILTDGYLYDKNVLYKKDNRYSYIDGDLLKKYKLRGSKTEYIDENTIKERIKKEDFGLITTRNDLQNLEVLVLEINPNKIYERDRDIIKIILENWFKEMGIKEDNYKVYNRVPNINDTINNIKNFFNEKKANSSSKNKSEEIIKNEIEQQ